MLLSDLHIYWNYYCCCCFFLLFWFSSLCLDIFTVGPHCVSCIKGLNPAYWVRTTLAAACQTSQHVITATINRHTQRHTPLIQCSWNVLTHVCVLWHFIGSILFATRESLETFCFFAIAVFCAEGRLMTLLYSNKARQTRISLCHKNYNNSNNRLICQYAYRLGKNIDECFPSEFAYNACHKLYNMLA